MVGGPEDTSPTDAGTGGSPTGPPHPPRPPVARAGGDDPAPKPASGFTSDQLRRGRQSPSQLERPVAQVVPREGRGRSASHPPNRLQGSQQTHPVDIPQEVVGSSRRSPAIPANHRDRTPAHGVIPVYPRPARNYQDRPVTPEVAGSSPVAPVLSFWSTVQLMAVVRCVGRPRNRGLPTSSLSPFAGSSGCARTGQPSFRSKRPARPRGGSGSRPTPEHRRSPRARR
jgi:hypothetical protein